MTDDQPSIAELQRAHVVAVDERADEVPWGNARDQILDAAPVLMEIAAAALAYERAKIEVAKAHQRYAQDGRDSLLVEVANCDSAQARCRSAYVTALSKVKP